MHVLDCQFNILIRPSENAKFGKLRNKIAPEYGRDGLVIRSRQGKKTNPGVLP